MKYYGASDIGLRRLQNQDSFIVTENAYGEVLAVVCDGIGGGLAGDVASSIAVSHLKDRFLRKQQATKEEDILDWLKTTIQEANDLIFMQATRCSEHKGMGTTCVGAFKMQDATYIFNVGDSRIYAQYPDAFLCLTEDHSFVQDLIRAGEISKEEAKFHPNRNMLTNALGIWNQVKIDINRIQDDYDILLICSDGLHGYVAEQDIQAVLKQPGTLQQKVQNLIYCSKQAGGYDNVSVILLENGDDHE